MSRPDMCGCGIAVKDHAPYPHEGRCEFCGADWPGVLCGDCQRLRLEVGAAEFQRRKAAQCGCIWCCRGEGAKSWGSHHPREWARLVLEVEMFRSVTGWGLANTWKHLHAMDYEAASRSFERTQEAWGSGRDEPLRASD